MKNYNITNIILWIVYLGLLAVLLPHTAWAFDQYEPSSLQRYANASVVAWIAAFTFESAIAVLTHKLAKHIETVPNYKSTWKKLNGRYINAYALGLFIAVAVSALANLSHAVEYGRSMALSQNQPWLSSVYVTAFGAVLPFTSLLFARVLSNVADDMTSGDTAEKERDKARRQLAKLTRAHDAGAVRLDKLKAELDAVRSGRDKAMAQLNEATAQLANGVVRLDALTPRLASYVTAVATGETPNGEFSSEHGIGATSLERANSTFGIKKRG